MNFMPISPVRTPSGALAAVAQLFGEEGSRPIPLADAKKALNNFQVISDSLSLDVAGKLGLGSIFGATTSASDKGFYFDAMTFTDEYVPRETADKVILATRWGVGVRVLLAVTDIKGEASLNFSLVGAAVELQQARARYEIQGIGIGLDGLRIVLEELPAIGDFKYDTYMKLNGSVVKKLAAYLGEHSADLEPLPIAVALARPVDTLIGARAVYYAMRRIADRRRLRDALQEAPQALDRETIRKIYVQVTKSDDPNEQPSQAAEDEAKAWLRH